MEKQHSHTLSKIERLKSKKLLDQLFQSGTSFGVGPVRVFYLLHNEKVESNLQVVTAVSKRNFKRAVDRNHIKRLLRESYRINNGFLKEILAEMPENMALGLFYRSSEIPVFKEVNDKIILSLQRLSQQIAEKGESS